MNFGGGVGGSISMVFSSGRGWRLYKHKDTQKQKTKSGGGEGGGRGVGVGVMSFCERKINSGTQEMRVSLKFTGEIFTRRYHV